MDVPVPSSSSAGGGVGVGEGVRTLDGQEEREGMNRNMGLGV